MSTPKFTEAKFFGAVAPGACGIMEGMEYKVENLVLDDGTCPAQEWLDALDDAMAARVLAYLNRLRGGNFGNFKPVAGAESLYEVTMDFGPGYRAYCGRDGLNLILVLCGGGKSTQRRDIARAKRIWKQYKGGR